MPPESPLPQDREMSIFQQGMEYQKREMVENLQADPQAWRVVRGRRRTVLLHGFLPCA